MKEKYTVWIFLNSLPKDSFEENVIVNAYLDLPKQDQDDLKNSIKQAYRSFLQKIEFVGTLEFLIGKSYNLSKMTSIFFTRVILISKEDGFKKVITDLDNIAFYFEQLVLSKVNLSLYDLIVENDIDLTNLLSSGLPEDFTKRYPKLFKEHQKIRLKYGIHVGDYKSKFNLIPPSKDE